PWATIDPIVNGRTKSHGGGPLIVVGVFPWSRGAPVVVDAVVEGALTCATSESESTKPWSCPGWCGSSTRFPRGAALALPILAVHAIAAPAAPAAIFPTSARRDSILCPPPRRNYDCLGYHSGVSQVKKNLSEPKKIFSPDRAINRPVDQVPKSASPGSRQRSLRGAEPGCLA